MSDIHNIEKKIAEDLISGRRGTLIEKLSFYTRFDNENQYSNFLKLVFVLLERAENEYEIVSNILLKSVFSETDDLKKIENFSRSRIFINELKKGTISPFIGLSTFIRRLIAADIDKEPLSGGRMVSDLIPRDILIDCNIHLLENYIQEFGIKGAENLNKAILLLYNCVCNIEGEKRLIKLDNRATAFILAKLKDDLSDYLQAFIRPKYVTNSRNFPEYYIHVPEPFYKQIFGSDEEFMYILNQYLMERSDSVLVQDVINFMTELGDNEAKGIDSVDLGKLQLFYPDHLNIRPEIKDRIKNSLPPASSAR